MTAEDIGRLFQDIELRLIGSLKRNLARHKAWEQDEEFDWPAWQSLALRGIRQFRKDNRDIVGEYREVIDEETAALLREQYAEGRQNIDDEVQALRDAGFDPAPGVELRREPVTENSFFGTDAPKLKSLIADMQTLEETAEKATFRTMDDIYRQTIYRAETAFSAGATTLPQAIDLAVKDFLAQGVNSIVYKDGSRHNIADYVQMALRTSATRAKLRGEAVRRKEIGVDTVLVSQYGACSNTCLPWQGRVYIDDVWGDFDGETSGTMGYSRNGKWYPLLSVALSAGLFHPNCRHTVTTWYEGISVMPKPLDAEKTKAAYKLEQRQRALERNVRKWKRMAEGTQRPEMAAAYRVKVKEAQKELRGFIAEHSDVLRRDPWRERTLGVPEAGDTTVANPGQTSIMEAYSGHSIRVISAGSISPETEKQVQTALDALSAEFPKVTHTLDDVRFEPLSDALGIDRFSVSASGQIRHSLSFDSAAFSNPSALMRRLKDDAASGYSYEASDICSLVAHEYGHAAHNALALKRAGWKPGTSLTAVQTAIFNSERSSITREIYLAAFSDEDLAEIQECCKRELGSAALVPTELIAQSFGSHFYGAKHSKIAASIVDFFRKGLK